MSMIRLHLMLVIILGFLWSFLPSMQALCAYATLAPMTLPQTGDLHSVDPFTTARKIQLHFLKFRIYIPLEDIMVGPNPAQTHDLGTSNETKSSSFGCIHDTNIMWIPLKYKVPILGERVLQWCLNIPLA